MNIGDRIRINNGQVEALVKIERPYGLFKSKTYQVVRRLGFKESEIVKEVIQTKLFDLA